MIDTPRSSLVRPQATAAEDALALTIAKEMFKREGTGPAFDIQIIDVGVGYAKLSMVLQDMMLNGHGTAHGGMIFTLADTAFAYACNARNVTTVAQHASISFLSPGKAGEKLTAEAIEEHQAGRSGIYHITVYGEDDRKVAIFQGLSRSIGGAVIAEDKR